MWEECIIGENGKVGGCSVVKYKILEKKGKREIWMKEIKRIKMEKGRELSGMNRE